MVELEAFYNQLYTELVNIDLINLILVFLLFYVPFHFSKKVQSTFFQLLYTIVGIYLLLNMSDPRIIYDVNMLVGLGALLPQLRFIKNSILDVILTIKVMCSNIYYFFLTLYYKLVRFINWLITPFVFLKVFFRERRNKSETSSNYNNEDSFNDNSQNQYYDWERDSSNNSYSSRDESYNSYKESEEDFNFNESETQDNSFYDDVEDETIDDELKQFYSNSAYVVLGVSEDDDFQ